MAKLGYCIICKNRLSTIDQVYCSPECKEKSGISKYVAFRNAIEDFIKMDLLQKSDQKIWFNELNKIPDNEESIKRYVDMKFSKKEAESIRRKASKILKEKNNKLEKKNKDAIKIFQEKIKEEDLEKRKLKDVDVKSFLIEGRTKFKSLGCGFNNNVYYFGTKLFREGKSYSAIVTSDKKIFINKSTKHKGEWIGDNQIKSKFNLKYKDEFYDEALDHIFSNKAIEKFLYGDISDITFENVYKKIVNVLKKYIYLEDERKYKLIACYRIAGFFMPIWKARARLFINAEAGSSKSRLADILHNTGFNSVNLGDWTLPFIQRMIESTRGETHIDDFETLDEEKQKATIRLVKTGYTKGKKAGKTGDNSRKPEVYDLFNTTTINAVIPLDFISTDRCITIRIPKISKSEYDQEPDFNKPIFNEIRDDLYILGLKESEKVNEIYPKIKSKVLSGRLFSIIKPELSIAKIISNELFDEIESFWAEEIEQRNYNDLTEDWEFQGFRRIYELIIEQQKNDYFTLYDDIVLPMIKEIYDDYPETIKKYGRSISTKLGRCLVRNPIFKHRQINGKTQYKVEKNHLIDLLKAKRYLKDIIGSTNSTTSTSSTSSTSSTTLKDVEDVEDVEVIEQEYVLKNNNKKNPPLLNFDEKCQIWKQCAFPKGSDSICGDSPCNEYEGMYYCKEHFKEVQVEKP